MREVLGILWRLVRFPLGTFATCAAALLGFALLQWAALRIQGGPALYVAQSQGHLALATLASHPGFALAAILVATALIVIFHLSSRRPAGI